MRASTNDNNAAWADSDAPDVKFIYGQFLRIETEITQTERHPAGIVSLPAGCLLVFYCCSFIFYCCSFILARISSFTSSVSVPGFQVRPASSLI